MNERLLLSLYDRSGLGAYMPVDLKGHELEVGEHMENFAESIVQECIHILNKRYMGDNNREDMEVKRCIEDVKKHFGIE